MTNGRYCSEWIPHMLFKHYLMSLLSTVENITQTTVENEIETQECMRIKSTKSKYMRSKMA
ncbi:hypothetical protein BLOT_005951 [Blomia tropicalis]|nr:hypothetical protein BLOT_005951 [Blomia tropicalis]